MHMAAREKKWTLDELHRLPDDGNKYELVRGDLFVTPAPRPSHEEILAALHQLLAEYVAANSLGRIYRPRAVVRFDGSEVEPDLMVRKSQPVATANWDSAPPPILVVEVLSDATRRRDRGPKREFYLDAGISEYWIIDGDAQNICVVRPGVPDTVVANELTWCPANANHPLTFDVATLFL